MAAPLPFVALAFLSKETAVVLPPLLNWAGFWVPRDPSVAVSRPRAILRETLPWCIAALYMLTRLAILGSFGATYNNRVISRRSGTGGSFTTSRSPCCSSSLRSTPWRPHRTGSRARRSAQSTLAASAALVAVGLIAGMRRGDGRRLVALAGGIGAPLFLLSPVYGVESSLEHSRVLCLPAVCWVGVLGLFLDRALARKRTGTLALVCAAALGVSGAAGLGVGLLPFTEATTMAEGALASLDAVPSGSEVLGLGVLTPQGMPPAITSHEGAYVLSGAIYHALREPYREPPGVRLVAVSDAAEIARTPPPGRPHLAALTQSADGRPVFVIIGPGGAVGEPPRLEPDGPTPSRGPLKIQLTQPKDRWSRLDSLKVVFADEHGRMIASEEAWHALAPALSAEGGLTIASDRATPPVTVEKLQEIGSRLLVYWAEGRAGGWVVFRTPWRALVVPSPRKSNVNA